MIRQFQVPQKSTALAIKTGDRIILWKYENIIYLEVQEKYVIVFTTQGKKYVTDQPLATLEENSLFSFTESKIYIINWDKIKEMHRHSNSRYLFVMDNKDETRLAFGRIYYDAIKADFDF